MNQLKKLLTNHKNLLILVSIVFGLVSLGILFFVLQYQKYSEFRSQASQGPVEYIAQVQPTNDPSQIETVQYQLLNGWNFVAFPLQPLSFQTAAELIKDIAENDGFVTAVAKWNGDRWEVFTHSGTDQFGMDFPIEPGKAYFLRSHQEFSWKVYGNPLAEAPTIELKKGWNAVGLTGQPESTAESVIDSINQGKDKAREIDWWQSGSWDVFVKRIYSKDNTRFYGNNFDIVPTRGYMMYLNQPETFAD